MRLLESVIEDLSYFTGLSKGELFDCLLRLEFAREELLRAVEVIE